MWESKNLDGTTVRLGGTSTARVTFAIAEGFRGVDGKREITIYTEEQGSSCGYVFQTGVEYLVFGYPRQTDGQVLTSACTGTRPISNLATDTDIQWMRSLPTAPAGARIYGTVTLANGQPAANTAISITGRQVADTTTDKDGRYSVSSLASGQYTVHAVPPAGFTIDTARPLAMEDRGCIQQDFWMQYDGHMRGRVTDEDGHAVANIYVVLQPTGASAQDRTVSMQAVSTQEDGSYDVDRLGPGEYLVEVNKNPSSDTPYPSRFYGGDVLHGQPVMVAASATVAGIDVVLPRAWKRIDIPVKVVDADGSPVAGVGINHRDEANRDGIQDDVQSGADGSATLHLFAGHNYQITAILQGGMQQRCSSTARVTAQPDTPPMTLQLAAGIGECNIW
jgi:hypothetical protein